MITSHSIIGLGGVCSFFLYVFSLFLSLPHVHAIEAARKFNVNAVDCSSVLRVTCPCFVCVFCDSFLCSISLLLLSDYLSCVLNSVL